MGWSGPWGVVYSANLTPDKETEQVSGAVVFPPPSEWDARNLPKPPGGEGK